MAKATNLRKRPGQARSRATVDAIVEAAARVFAEVGYRHLTTNKVAEVAGVSIGSLYQYFENKEALITAVHQRHRQRIREAMLREFDVPGDLLDNAAINQLIRSVYRVHSIEPGMQARFEMLRQEGSFTGELGENEFDEFATRLENALQKTETLTIKDPRLSAWILVTTVHTLIHAFEQSDLPYSDEQKIAEITRIVSGYVATMASEQSEFR